jgi:hypothetical protein
VATSPYNQVGLVDTAKYLRPSGPKYKTYIEGIGIGNRASAISVCSTLRLIGNLFITALISSFTTFLQVIGNPIIITIVPNGVGIEINGL